MSHFVSQRNRANVKINTSDFIVRQWFDDHRRHNRCVQCERTFCRCFALCRIIIIDLFAFGISFTIVTATTVFCLPLRCKHWSLALFVFVCRLECVTLPQTTEWKQKHNRLSAISIYLRKTEMKWMTSMHFLLFVFTMETFSLNHTHTSTQTHITFIAVASIWKIQWFADANNSIKW